MSQFPSQKIFFIYVIKSSSPSSSCQFTNIAFVKIPHICYSFYFYIFYYADVERQLAYFCKTTTLTLDDGRKTKYALSITVSTETEYISLCSSIHMRNKNIFLEWLIILSNKGKVVKVLSKIGQISIRNLLKSNTLIRKTRIVIK